MSRRKVREVMTTEVLAVAVDTPVSELAAIMSATGFRTVPVLGASGRVAGLVAAADLQPPCTPRGHPAARRVLCRARRPQPPAARAPAAQDVMRVPVVTTSPEAPLAEAARSMSRNQLSELPVADSCGHLVGIVSWADLGRVFVRPDCDLVHEIVRDVFVRHLGTDPSLVRVAVQDGLVTLSGSVAAESMIPLAVAMCRAIDGVVDVVSYLAYAAGGIAVAGGPVAAAPVAGGPVAGGPVAGGPVAGGPVAGGPVAAARRLPPGAS
jgi:CBS domain-containing protein